MGSSAPLALQLKAVEAEYHGLKEAGQTHKAEHVQQLYAWKSKKALQVRVIGYTTMSRTLKKRTPATGQPGLLLCGHREPTL